MKHYEWIYKPNAVKVLYIPHGSDETQYKQIEQVSNLRTLYPTRFRWNQRLTNSSGNRISQLYIPHGSDETPTAI